MLKKIFGIRRDEETKSCRGLHNEKLHNFYYSPSAFKMVQLGERAEHLARI
jgi:hypothetical protein